VGHGVGFPGEIKTQRAGALETAPGLLPVGLDRHAFNLGTGLRPCEQVPLLRGGQTPAEQEVDAPVVGTGAQHGPVQVVSGMRPQPFPQGQDQVAQHGAADGTGLDGGQTLADSVSEFASAHSEVEFVSGAVGVGRGTDPCKVKAIKTAEPPQGFHDFGLFERHLAFVWKGLQQAAGTHLEMGTGRGNPVGRGRGDADDLAGFAVVLELHLVSGHGGTVEPDLAPVGAEAEHAVVADIDDVRGGEGHEGDFLLAETEVVR